MREKSTGRWCLSQGLKETISDESEVSAVATPYRVTLYCSSVPQRAGSSDSCTGPAHKHKHSSSVGSRGTQPPKLGSELCTAGWCHNTRTGHCKHQHHPARALCTPEPSLGAAPVQGCSLPAVLPQLQTPAHQLSPLPVPLSYPQTAGTSQELHLSPAPTENRGCYTSHRQRTGNSSISPTWLGLNRK